VIAITNIDPNPRPFGTHLYELCINREVIATFTHQREEGLTKCLELAAKAAEHAKWMKAEAMLQMLRQTPTQARPEDDQSF